MKTCMISVLGHSTMDAAHEEFDRLIAVCTATDDEQFPTHLSSLIEHLRAHFEDEDRQMCASAFPPKDCHIREHDAVLRSASEVWQRIQPGKLDLGRAFVEELANWFPGHVDYLDSALAAWLSKQRYGGKPVVLQRPRRAHPQVKAIA